MKNVTLIARRELQAYLRTMSGYVIIAVMLFIDGLLFNAFAVPGPAKKSSEILADFFTLTSGITMVGAVFLSMRLIAEERQTGTLVLLSTSPLRESEVVLGKFVAAFGFITLMTGLTAYLPLLIFVHGKVSVGHILVGYLGLLLIGSATLAIGVFASALAPTPALRVEMTVERSKGTVPFPVASVPPLMLRRETQAAPTTRAGTVQRGTRRGSGCCRAWVRTLPTFSAASRRRISCQREGSVEFMGSALLGRRLPRAPCRSVRPSPGWPTRGGLPNALRGRRARGRGPARTSPPALNRRPPGGRP